MPRSINALIVDDSLTTRRLIMSALKQTGLADFVFTEAQDGVDALTKYQAGMTQLIFVDMNMPRMSGLEFVREMRQLHPVCPPMVMITGETNSDRLREALAEVGVGALLLKPVDRDRLRAGLKAVVDAIPANNGKCAVPHGEYVPLALREVLVKACDLELTPAADNEQVRLGDVVLSMFAVFGDLHWSVSVGFSAEAAAGVAARFAATSETPTDAHIGDAIGELTNIVGGRLRHLLSGLETTVKISLPSVIRASGLRLLTPRQLNATVAYTHFDSSVGAVWTGVTVGLAGGIVL